MPPGNTYCLTWVSLTLDERYLLTLHERYLLMVPPPDLERGEGLLLSISSQPYCACAATAPWTWVAPLNKPVIVNT